MVAVELAGRYWKIGAVRALLHYQLCLDDKPLFNYLTTLASVFVAIGVTLATYGKKKEAGK